MKEVTIVHEIVIFAMASFWFIHHFYVAIKHGSVKAWGKSFWGLVAIYAVIFAMAFSDNIQLIIGVITGAIANELTRTINKHRD